MSTTPMESFLSRVRNQIRKHGFTSISVFASEDGSPGFTYTVGLCRKNAGFELLVVGINAELAHEILTQLAAWPEIPLDEPVHGVIKDLPVMFKMTRRGMGHHYARTAQVVYGNSVNIVQLVLPDKNGAFPGDAGYDAAGMHWQPQLWGKLLFTHDSATPAVLH